LKLLPPKSGSGRQIEMWMQQVSAEMTRINFSLARAYLSADTVINHIAEDKILLDVENFDLGNNFGSYKYTAPITGYYQVNAAVLYYDVHGKLYLATMTVRKNGVICSSAPYWAGVDKTWVGTSVNDIVYLTAGQYLELFGYVQTTDSSSAVIYGGSAYTFMSVHLIST